MHRPLLTPLLLFALMGPANAETPTQGSLEDQDERSDLKAEYEKRRAAAEGDIAKLWELVGWCDASGLDKERKSTLRAILKLDENDEKAHTGLGHVLHEGKWYNSEKELEAALKKLGADKAKAEEKLAKEKGLVKFGATWVAPADLPFLERGMVKDATGAWVSPEEAEKLKNGWTRQDLEWVPPEEKANVEKGLWKCGSEWLALAEADAYHAKLGTWWRLPTEHFHLYTTLKREVAQTAAIEIDRAYVDLLRIFGESPALPPVVLILNAADQYNTFAAGGGALPATDALGLSSIHGSYFADLWFEQSDQGQPRFMAAGICYWDASNDAGNRFGSTFARHAAGQSFIEALDPSPNAIAALAGGGGAVDAFWAEKKLPKWFRYGAAAYVERYYVDPFAAPAIGKEWARKWSAGEILRQGGLDGLDKVFECALSVDNRDGSAKLINETGLLLSFILDAQNKDLVKLHGAFKDSFRALRTSPADETATKEFQKVLEDLQKTIIASEDKLLVFADL